MSDALAVEAPPLFTRSDLAIINAARDSLDKINQDARSTAYSTPVSNGMDANACDYARVGLRAELAANALFDLLNLANASGVHKITDVVMHRRDDVV